MCCGEIWPTEACWGWGQHSCVPPSPATLWWGGGRLSSLSNLHSEKFIRAPTLESDYLGLISDFITSELCDLDQVIDISVLQNPLL